MAEPRPLTAAPIKCTQKTSDAGQASLLAYRPTLQLQALLQTPRQGRHELLLGRIFLGHLDDAPLEDGEAIRGLFLLAQHVLCPGPDVLLRSQVWRMSGPGAQKAHAALAHCVLRLVRVHN